MLRWVCHKTCKDEIRNESSSEYLGIKLTEDKIKEKRLTWLGDYP